MYRSLAFYWTKAWHCTLLLLMHSRYVSKMMRWTTRTTAQSITVMSSWFWIDQQAKQSGRQVSDARIERWFMNDGNFTLTFDVG